MSVKVNVSTPAGEVAKVILSKTLVGNELVERGLISILPNVHHEIDIPRVKVSKVLQPRDPNPDVTKDAQGEIELSSRKLAPEDAMALTYFNPARFEHLYRPYQPTGELLYEELPAEVQETLLMAISKQATYEIGDQMINGGLKADDKLFKGIIVRMMSCGDRIDVTTSSTKMIDRLAAVYKKIPAPMLKSPNLRILMSVSDWQTYDTELSAQTSKGKDVTTTNLKRYKDIQIEDLAVWPEGLIVATICSDDADSNIWGACNVESDMIRIKVGKVSEVSELMFVKMLFKFDTQIAFGDELVVLDKRSGLTEGSIKATPEVVALPATGGEAAVLVVASGDYNISGTYTGFTVSKVEGGLLIKAEDNGTGSDRSGEAILTLTGAASSVKTTVRLFQPKKA